MAETSYSTTKRSLGDAVRALGWYRQFREIVLMFTIINIEQLCEHCNCDSASIQQSNSLKLIDSNFLRATHRALIGIWFNTISTVPTLMEVCYRVSESNDRQ